MKRQPPAPKYDLRCRWCGNTLTRNAGSWSVERDVKKHDQECHVADRRNRERSGQLPTKGGANA